MTAGLSSSRAPQSAPSSSTFPSPAQPDALSGLEYARQAIASTTGPRAAAAHDSALLDLARGVTRKDLELQLPRRYSGGMIYAPHDLSPSEMAKWKKPRRKPKSNSKTYDVIDQLGLGKVLAGKGGGIYKEFGVISEYVTDMGRIRGGTETGLRPVNQRRMARAIRRAIGVGLVPSVYRHPEVLRLEMPRRGY